MRTDPAWLKENRPIRYWMAVFSAERRAERAAAEEAMRKEPIRYTVRPLALPKAISPTKPFSPAQRKAHRLAACKPLKSRLYAAQDGNCYLCGYHMGAVRQATEDHVTPRARGGRNASNLLLAHSACNNHKGAREPYPCELIYLRTINLIVVHRARPHIREALDRAA